MPRLKNLVSARQLNIKFVDEILKQAAKMESAVKAGKILKDLSGKIVACIFFEPSTRTRLSFETAVLRLGGQVISMENGSVSSSAFKGESLHDTIKIVQNYVDAIVMRHPVDGSAKIAAEVATVPLINAGDGANQHPSQALLDIYTVYKKFHRLNNLKFAIGFDPKHSRTEKSFCELLLLFGKNEFTFICPKALEPPKELLKKITAAGATFKITQKLEDGLNKDIFYTNRLQEERFSSKGEFERLRHQFRLTRGMLKNKKVLIMNPLPRIDEMEPEVDQLPNAIFFEQAKNGLFVRMAILKMLLGK